MANMSMGRVRPAFSLIAPIVTKSFDCTKCYQQELIVFNVPVTYNYNNTLLLIAGLPDGWEQAVTLEGILYYIE